MIKITKDEILHKMHVVIFNIIYNIHADHDCPQIINWLIKYQHFITHIFAYTDVGTAYSEYLCIFIQKGVEQKKKQIIGMFIQ